MTTTFDPHDPIYTDEADVRGELTRVFDACNGCRRCLDLCVTFPTLFDLLDGRDGAGDLTPHEQDSVSTSCLQCSHCVTVCPYAPTRHADQIDVPLTLLRAAAMRHEHGHVTAESVRLRRLVGRADRVGAAATRLAPAVNRVLGAAPGSLVRRLVRRLTGLTATRPIPPFAVERFSTWFRSRPRLRLGKKQGSVVVVPTCVVEFQATGIGRDLVRVYERNGIECSLSEAGCCGAPSLHAGDIERFAAIAERNTRTLAREIRSGAIVVVPDPGCGHVIKRHVPRHVGASARADAEFVAEHTRDAAEYLLETHQGDDSVLDTDFRGDTPRSVALRSSSQLRSEHVGFAGRDLLKLTGARVESVQACAVDGLWGLRGDVDGAAEFATTRLVDRLEAMRGDVVGDDAALSAHTTAQAVGRDVAHPVQVIARTYGIPSD